MSAENSVIAFEGLAKSFGGVKALLEADLNIAAGERVAVIGHNGAGKSTLVNLLLGVFAPTEGRIFLSGNDVTAQHDIRTSFAGGVRCVFQELSLCANLTVYENLALQHIGLRNAGWRGRAKQMMRHALDEVFPGNGINVEEKVANLSIGQRQMVEIARAFVPVSAPVKLVILDEPTSSLDSRATDSLLTFLRSKSETGVAIVFISHRLREVLRLVDRVVVMRDGRIVADRTSRSLDKDGLVTLMSHEVAKAGLATSRTITPGRNFLKVVRAVGRPISLQAGEIVGLAGLDGHGQRRFLHRVFLNQRLSGETISLSARLSFVSGDRHGEGVFPLWSVGRNITVGLVKQLQTYGVLLPNRETSVVSKWMNNLKIRATNADVPILSLSGGNQQKALIARSLASDADLILLDDPTRGVDVNTKRELYETVRAEADTGRGFLWYTTELEELEVCDRVYVFYEDRVTDEIPREQLSEERLLRASFEEAVQP